MVIKTNIAGVIKTIDGLSKNVNKYVSDASGDFMKEVLIAARKRAPRDTKWLSRNMAVTKTKNGWDLIVASRQGFFQEEGFKPHWIHSDMIENSTKLRGEGFFFVKKSTPFVRPALSHSLAHLPKILSSATKQAIAKRGG